jgi:hypothetical protein
MNAGDTKTLTMKVNVYDPTRRISNTKARSM